jgi:hypothetical protein
MRWVLVAALCRNPAVCVIATPPLLSASRCALRVVLQSLQSLQLTEAGERVRRLRVERAQRRAGIVPPPPPKVSPSTRAVAATLSLWDGEPDSPDPLTMTTAVYTPSKCLHVQLRRCGAGALVVSVAVLLPCVLLPLLSCCSCVAAVAVLLLALLLLLLVLFPHHCCGCR